MPQEPKLPPLEKEAFDGHREEAAIHRDIPLTQTCKHTNVQIVTSTELRCGCGAGWSGPDILKLYSALKKQ